MTSNGQLRDVEWEALADEVIDFVEGGPDGDPDRFEPLALKVFAAQYERNEPYRESCDAGGVRFDAVTRWQEIPALPSAAFRDHLVTSFPPSDTIHAFRTSGTTSPTYGRVIRDAAGLRLLLSANRQMAQGFLFPDVTEERRIRILVLGPSLKIAPSMGFAFGMDHACRYFGTQDSRFLMTYSGMDAEALVGALREAEERAEPVALIGSTSAFVYFFDACLRHDLTFRLPQGSRIGDAGGYRGRFGQVTRTDYYRLVTQILGVGGAHCVNVLGTSESATNHYDDVLRRHVRGLEPAERHKPDPPWCRTVAVSIEDLTPLPHGEIGLLRHHDVANLPTAIGVQTDNLGCTDERGGFEIVGRARIEEGRVSLLPGDRAVGAMGDLRLYGLLERFVKFSIDFRMGRLAPADVPADEAS